MCQNILKMLQGSKSICGLNSAHATCQFATLHLAVQEQGVGLDGEFSPAGKSQRPPPTWVMDLQEHPVFENSLRRLTGLRMCPAGTCPSERT